MKKILYSILFIFLLSFNFLFISYSIANNINPNLQKIDSLHINFLDKIQSYSYEKKILILENISKKIDLLKIEYQIKEKQEVLNYLWFKIKQDSFNLKFNYFKDKDSISPLEYQKILWIWMDVDWLKTKDWKQNYSLQTVKDFKLRWINHVRIRIQDDFDEKLIQSLEKIIDDCLDNWIIPIVAYQADYFKKEQSDKNMEKFVNWWWNISDKLKTKSHLVTFDLIIEVTDSLNKNQKALNEAYEKAVNKIRETNQTRIIFISPVLRSAPENLQYLKIPTNHNNFLMAEWHFYASWPSKTNNLKLWTNWNENEKKLIKDKIKYALDWQKNTWIYTWVWAWMPGNYNDENNYSIEEQKIFASFVSNELEKNNIPFSFNSDTKFYDREKNIWINWMDELLDVILYNR